MKNTVCTILSLLLFAIPNVNSQVTITKDHMPSVGDTIRYSTVNGVGLDLNLNFTGANKSWDYTSLKAISTSLYEYESALKTPYIFSFFGALGLKIGDTLGFGQMSATNVYGFYENSTSGYNQVGYGFTIAMPGTSVPIPLSGKYTDKDEIYEFPLTYNDSYSNTFNLEIPIGTFPFILGNFYRTGQRSTVVDGWGKISTPYKKDVDCIRVKSIYNSNDSIAITTPALNFGVPTKTVEYKWLSPTEKIPLLEIIGNEVGGVFTPTSVRYRGGESAPQSSSISEIDFKLVLSPNPVINTLQVQSSIKTNHYAKLYNTSGQLVKSFLISNGKANVDFAKMNRGVYFIKTEYGVSKIVH